MAFNGRCRSRSRGRALRGPWPPLGGEARPGAGGDEADPARPGPAGGMMGRVRRVVWAGGWPVRSGAIVAIRIYRVTLSPFFGGQCRFYPSCSVYAEVVVR